MDKGVLELRTWARDVIVVCESSWLEFMRIRSTDSCNVNLFPEYETGSKKYLKLQIFRTRQIESKPGFVIIELNDPNATEYKFQVRTTTSRNKGRFEISRGGINTLSVIPNSQSDQTVTFTVIN